MLRKWVRVKGLNYVLKFDLRSDRQVELTICCVSMQLNTFGQSLCIYSAIVFRYVLKHALWYDHQTFKLIFCCFPESETTEGSRISACAIKVSGCMQTLFNNKNCLLLHTAPTMLWPLKLYMCGCQDRHGWMWQLLYTIKWESGGSP